MASTNELVAAIKKLWGHRFSAINTSPILGKKVSCHMHH